MERRSERSREYRRPARARKAAPRDSLRRSGAPPGTAREVPPGIERRARLSYGTLLQGYRSTVGVSIDRKAVEVDGREATLMLWDPQQEDGTTKIRLPYIGSSTGSFLVADGTRESKPGHRRASSRRGARRRR